MPKKSDPNITVGNKSVWEILVPTIRQDGTPYKTRFHRVWDRKVRAISGGLTVMPVVRGQWDHEGETIAERMIPVRVLADEKAMMKVVSMTLAYYDQKAVLAYRISDVYIWGTSDDAKE